MSHDQDEIEFLTQELRAVREELSLAGVEKAALGNLCRSYHQILFGIPLHENLDKVLKAVALGFAASWEGENPPARNFVMQDVTVTSPKPLTLNITVQRVDGKSPHTVLGELQNAVVALIDTLALYNPTLANKVSRCFPEEIPPLLKGAALAADRG